MIKRRKVPKFSILRLRQKTKGQKFNLFGRAFRTYFFKFYFYTGPNHWLDHYPTCGGHRQSPVDIRTGEVEYASWLDDFQFFGYEKYIGNTIKNNGHTGK